MKVCLICSQIAAWGKIGGFGTNARRLGRGLVAAGHDVHVVVPRRSAQSKVEKLDGMTVYGQSTLEVFFGTRIYQQIDADIYHVQEPNICGYWAHKAMPQRIHLITSMDPREQKDWWIELKNATWSRRLKFPIQYYYENGPLVRKSVKNTHEIYVEAPFLKSKTQRLYDLEKEPGLLPKPIEIPKGPFIKSKRPSCVFVGRFDPRKRPEMFFQLAKRMPDVDFIAVGKAHDKTYQEYLERNFYGIPNLEVTGFVDPFSDDKFHNILSQAWILVHPAAREGLPTAFQEASVHEVAILAYVDPGEYVSQFGRVVNEKGGVQELEKNLQDMINSSEWFKKGKAGREYNIKNHSLSISIEEHIKVYEMWLQRSKVAPRF